MTRYPVRLGLSLALIAALAGTAVTIAVTAPAISSPAPTAFADGPYDMRSWANAVGGLGYDLQSMVSDPRLIDTIQEPSRVLIVVAGLTAPLGEDHARALETHLQGGGAVWIADGKAAVNDWLSTHGIAVLGPTLLDSKSGNAKWVNLTVANDAEQTVTAFAPSLLALNATLDWRPLLVAPATVHVDVLDDGAIDTADRPGPHLVGAERTFDSGGRLVVTADSSMLTNLVWDAQGVQNAWTSRDIITTHLSSGGVILVDETQSGWTKTEAPVAFLTDNVATLAYGRIATQILPIAAIALTGGWAAAQSPSLESFRAHERHDPILRASRPRDQGTRVQAGPSHDQKTLQELTQP